MNPAEMGLRRDRLSDIEVRTLSAIFKPEMVRRIRDKLPYLFYLAQAEVSRGGKTGMEVGTIREQILIALLAYVFGEENIDTGVKITQPEIDVKVLGIPVSIKTISGQRLGGVKVVWTVDWARVNKFVQLYKPKGHIILAHVNWDALGGLYIIPLHVQSRVFNMLGRTRYLKIPRRGTNPRGVEISGEAVRKMASDGETQKMLITWVKPDRPIPPPYKRWLDYWRA
jgi:hypothetical protein